MQRERIRSLPERQLMRKEDAVRHWEIILTLKDSSQRLQVKLLMQKEVILRHAQRMPMPRVRIPLH
ncbi:hypothetical protein D3C76_1587000 [compost metagenome]